MLASFAAACTNPSTTTTAGSSTTTSDRPGSTASAATTAVAASTDVATATLDLVDESRPTPAGAETPAADTRTLTTSVWYPGGAGPYPLIVFAHGLDGEPAKFSELFEAWAAAGFVVVAPAFPLTNHQVPSAWSNFADVANQPADMSFVTDQVLAANDDPGSPLAGRIDPERIGFGGLSLGGATTYLAGLNEATRDPRVDAAMVLDGVAGHDDATGTFLEPSGVPALIAHCDGDPLASLTVAQDAYALIIPPKYLVTLHGVCHAEAFEDTPHPLDEAGTVITTAFWQAWLAGEGTDEQRTNLADVLEAQGDALTWESVES